MAKKKKSKFGHGGARPGAGRPRKEGTIPHVARPSLPRDCPVHVVVRAAPGLPSLASPAARAVIREALDEVRSKAEKDFHVVHCSIEKARLVLVVEATSKTALSRGMQGLVIRIARHLNRTLSRRGKVWNGRYDRHDLTSPAEVRAVLRDMAANVPAETQATPRTALLRRIRTDRS